METKEQIEIVKELLDATKELNGEYQDGWDKNIKDGEKLIKFLSTPSQDNKLRELVKLLEKDPDRRPQQTAAVARTLGALAEV